MTAKARRLAIYLLAAVLLFIGVITIIHGILLGICSVGASVCPSIYGWLPFLALIGGAPITSIIAVQVTALSMIGAILIYTSKGMFGLAMWAFIVAVVIFIVMIALTALAASLFVFMWIFFLVVLLWNHDAF